MGGTYEPLGIYYLVYINEIQKKKTLMHYAVMEYRMTVMKMIRNDDDSRYSLENNEKKNIFL